MSGVLVHELTSYTYFRPWPPVGRQPDDVQVTRCVQWTGETDQSGDGVDREVRLLLEQSVADQRDVVSVHSLTTAS